MPPEPLPPWDRKDLLKEKRLDRTDALAPVSRWRNSHQGPREDPRRPPGLGKQGNYRLSPEESGHGCLSARASERVFQTTAEGESGRPSVSRYGRSSNGRENTGSLGGTEDYKSQLQLPHHWEAVEDDHLVVRSYPSLPQSEIENTSSLDQSQLNDKEQPLGHIAWKPLKWSRSSSLSSRGSGSFSLSEETRLDLLPGKSTPLRSPSSGEVSTGLTNFPPSEETCSRKKQRLGWGQGLAKYEKEKVEGPDVPVSKNGLMEYPNNSKRGHSMPCLHERSPTIRGLSECASPATPSSVACSFSPGLEDKPFVRILNADSDACHSSDSPGHWFPRHTENFFANPSENLELDPINNLSSLLVNMLQAEDVSFGESNYVRSTALNKLLLIKNIVLKALEKTEGEIDSFENELKAQHSEPRVTFASATKSTQADDVVNIRKEESNSVVNLAERCPLPCDSPVEIHDETKSNNVTTPGTVTYQSKEAKGDDEICVSEIAKDEPPADFKMLKLSGSCGLLVNENDTSPSVPSEANLQTEDSNLASLILASNKESSIKASEVFNKVLPDDSSKIDIWEAHRNASYRQNDLQIKEMLTMRKCSQRFKERLLTLKFRAFHHLWKEDVRLLSLRKQRPKSHKRFELSCRSIQGGYQKHKSIRSRFNSPGNLTLVPTTEIVEFTSKLLSDSHIKFHRNNLKMPALILDKNERRHSRFITSNGLVEDPCVAEKEREMINPWTQEEKDAFLEMLATFGKDFAKIASFLNHKTTADCIEFYYKSHKSESFEKIKTRLELRKQGRGFPINTYLVTSGKKWNREANSASLDMLGAVSEVAANAGRSMLGGRSFYDSHVKADPSNGKHIDANMQENENEAAAADVLAGICGGGLSSEAMSSCITTSIDPVEGFLSQKRNHSIVDRSFTLEVSGTIDEDDTCSDDSCKELDSVDWTDEEKSNFIMALRSYGRDFTSIARCVRTRSRDQCKIFFSKARKCLGLDVIHPVTQGTPISDANGGRSDSEEDACVVEMDSAICSTQSCSKMNGDLGNRSSEGHGDGRINPLQTDLDRLCEKDEVGVDLQEHGSQIEKSVPSDLQVGEVKMEPDLNDEDQLVKEEEGQSEIMSEVLQSEEKVSRMDLASGCTLSFQVDTEIKVEGTDKVVELKQETETANPGKHKSVPDSNAFSMPHARSDPQIVSNETSCKSSNYGIVSDSNMNLSSSHHGGVGRYVQSEISFVPKHQNVTAQKFSSGQKTQIISWQKNEHPLSEVSASKLLESSSVHYENRACQSAPSTLNFEEHEKTQHRKSLSPEFYQQHLLQHQSMDRGDQPVQILRGYPLRLMNKKEGNVEAADLAGENSTALNFPASNFQSNQYYVQDLYREKCNGSKYPLTNLPMSELSFLPNNVDHQPDDTLRCSSLTEDQTRKTGDFKLFGQILSHLSPLNKLNLSQRDDDKAPYPQSNKSIRLKFSSEHRRDANTTMLKKIEPSSRFLGVEEFPVTSNGFWDGTRIQTGLPSVSDSSTGSVNYPGAISDYPQLRRVFPTSSSNAGLTDAYQLYRSFSGSHIKPFSMVDVKQLRQERILSELQNQERILSELQKKRTGFEPTGVLGYQQGVGMNASGGGILVGGDFTGVSDPVAAIKMHYAASEKRFSSGRIGREEDSWRGGDVGR